MPDAACSDSYWQSAGFRVLISLHCSKYVRCVIGVFIALRVFRDPDRCDIVCHLYILWFESGLTVDGDNCLIRIVAVDCWPLSSYNTVVISSIWFSWSAAMAHPEPWGCRRLSIVYSSHAFMVLVIWYWIHDVMSEVYTPYIYTLPLGYPLCSRSIIITYRYITE